MIACIDAGGAHEGGQRRGIAFRRPEGDILLAQMRSAGDLFGICRLCTPHAGIRRHPRQNP